MKGIAAVALIWIAVFIFWALTTSLPASAVEDLGEPDILKAACASLAQNALTQGVTLTHCRQTAPADLSLDGRSAVAHLSVFVKEAGFRRTADVYLTKSLWHQDGFNLTN